MSFSLATLSLDFVANFSKLTGDVDQIQRHVKGAMKEIDSAIGTAKTAFAALGVTLSVNAFAGMVKGSIDAAGSLHDLSIKTGASVESLSKFGQVGALSGVSADQLGMAMNRLAKGMSVSNEESKGTTDALKALGLNFEDFRRLKPEDQMLSVAQAMSKFEDGTGKSAVAMTLFGKQGAELLPFMKDLAEAGDVQALVTARQAAESDRFGDTLAGLGNATAGYKHELAMGMLPALNEAAGAMLSVATESGGLRDQLRKLAADGTIAAWTHTAVTVLTYLGDAVVYVWRTFKAFGEFVGGMLAKTADALLSTGRAAKLALTGDFKGALDELSASQKRQNAITEDMGRTIKAIFSEETMFGRLRKAMVEQQFLGQATKASTAEQLNFSVAAEKTSKASKDLATAIKSLTTVEETQIALLKSWKKEQRDVLEAQEKETKTIQEKVKQQEEANRELLLTTDQLREFEEATLRAAAAEKRRLAGLEETIIANKELAAEYMKQAAALDTLADKVKEGKAAQAAKDARDEWKKATDQINESMTDALFRAFEDGKGFFKAFKDTLVNTFKTMVLRPTVELLMAPISGALASLFGGSAAAGTGGGGAGGLGGMLGSIKALFSKNSLTAWGGGLLGGYMGGSLISGQYGSSAVTMAGTGIGALVGGPLGALVGGLVGGVVNRLFGRGPKKITEKGLVGDIVGGDFEGQLYSDWKRKGGLFRSSKRGTDYSDVSGDLGLRLDQAGAEIFSGVADYARALSLPGDALAKVNYHLKVKLTDDEAENERLIAQALEGYESALAETFRGALRPFIEAGEDVSDTLERLAAIQVFSESLNEFGGVFSRIAMLGVTAKEELIGFAGGIEALIGKVTSFVQGYYSQEEQLGLGARQISGTLSSLGYDPAAVNSRADLRALVESVDISTTEGRRTFDALLTLSQQFLPIAQFLEQNGATLVDLAARAPTTGVVGNVLSDPEIIAEYQQRTADGIDQLNGSVQSIGAQLMEAIRTGNADMIATLMAILRSTTDTAGTLSRWDDGDAMLTTTAP